MKATVPLTSDHYQGPRRRSVLLSARPIKVEIVPDEARAAVLASFDERQDEPFEVPAWLAKRVLKRTWRFNNAADRLTTCLALLYPKGLAPTRGEIAFHAEQACSITGLAMTEENLKAILARAGEAAEDLFRRGYRLPRETILTHREARQRAEARKAEETTADV